MRGTREAGREGKYTQTGLNFQVKYQRDNEPFPLHIATTKGKAKKPLDGIIIGQQTINL